MSIAWYKYNLKNLYFQMYGMKKGLIKKIDRNLIIKLRDIYCGNIPASIILTSNNLRQGNCEVCSMLLTLALGRSKFNLNYADIEDLTLNPNNKDAKSYNHCYIETKDVFNNTWIYDTSTGYKYNEELYNKMQHPKIEKILTETTIKKDKLYNCLLDGKIDIECDIDKLALEEPNNQELQEEIFVFKSNSKKR